MLCRGRYTLFEPRDAHVSAHSGESCIDVQGFARSHPRLFTAVHTLVRERSRFSHSCFSSHGVGGSQCCCRFFKRILPRQDAGPREGVRTCHCRPPWLGHLKRCYCIGHIPFREVIEAMFSAESFGGGDHFAFGMRAGEAGGRPAGGPNGEVGCSRTC